MKYYVPAAGSIGYLAISRCFHPDHRQMLTNSKFFVGGERIVMDVKPDKIIFRKPGIFHIGKTRKLSVVARGWVKLTVVMDLPIGKFEFDLDESNVDEMVVYLQ